MHIYMLDNKGQDKLFLEKQPVKGRAVIAIQDVDSLTPGNEVVVQLTNRAKYKGVILDYKYIVVKGNAEGELTLVRK